MKDSRRRKELDEIIEYIEAEGVESPIELSSISIENELIKKSKEIENLFGNILKLS